MKPEISVIIPLYNKENIINQCVDSILSQSFENFELIIVNDGSTDNSLEIVKSIHDDRIRIIEQKNGGPSKARNTGVKKANGDWIYFIDADDEMLSGTLNHFIRLINNNPNIELFCGEVVIKTSKEKYIAKTYKDCIISNPFKAFVKNQLIQYTGSSVFKKKLSLNFLFNENLRRYEDYECLFRMYKNNKIYITHYQVVQINTLYASASHARKSIQDDFIGHLNIRGKSFWEKMALYKLYIQERENYPIEIKELYPDLSKRIDMFLFYKLFQFIY